MQDQGKRLLIAVALALGVMFAWTTFFPQKKPDQPAAGSGAGSGSAAHVAGNMPTTTVGVSPTQPYPAIAKDRAPEQLIKLDFPNFQVAFSSYGGTIQSWHLKDKRYDRDKTKGELLPQKPDAGAFSVNFANSTYVLPTGAVWQGAQVSPSEVKYSIETDNLKVEKTFTIVPEAYIVRMSVRAEIKVPQGQQAKQTLAVTMFGFQDPNDNGGGGRSVAPRMWYSATYANGTHMQTPVKAVLKKPRFAATKVAWSGYEHPYLLVVMAPKPSPDATIEKHTFAVGTDGLMRTDLLWRPEVVYSPGSQPIQREVIGYLGPKNYDQLKHADGVAGFSTHIKETIDLGWFAFIGRPLLWLLLKFYSFFQNWGIAIVLLTLLVKALTIPLVTRSMRSMKAIAVLAPQMEQLKKKYENDRQRLQMETMALYKQHGANPLSGCLPLFLQMPIWLALYRMLSNAGELYQQPFIHGWIDDLTMSDPFHVMPVVLMVTMFLQARLQPMAATTDPAQKMQQRMMQYGLPLMFGVMSFFFPAGLTLYIFTNTILSAVHSIYMNKFDKKSLELAAKLRAAREKVEQEKQAAEKPKAKPEADDSEASEDVKSGPRPNQGNRNKRKKRRH